MTIFRVPRAQKLSPNFFLPIIYDVPLVLFLIYASILNSQTKIAGFIIFDTHMIMTRVSPEEYVIATIELYLDIINLFIQILKILSELNRK